MASEMEKQAHRPRRSNQLAKAEKDSGQASDSLRNEVIPDGAEPGAERSDGFDRRPQDFPKKNRFSDNPNDFADSKERGRIAAAHR